MISLGTHQSAVWGYSILTYPTDSRLPNPPSTASTSYTGIFTKLTLAPNGNMYAILLVTDLTINGVSQTSVFLKITPGTSNTGTTNWQAATRSYLVPETSFTTDPATGFGRANWGIPDIGSGTIRYHTGILAPNGLIYFAPYVANSGWVIFNPATETWKTTTALKANSFTAALPVTYAFSGIALGTDNKIYAIGGPHAGTKMKSFRFTPSTNALNDAASIEDSYYPNYVSGGSPLSYTDRSWTTPQGSTVIDSPNLDAISLAHDTVGGSTAIKNLGLIRDMITHPSDKIFLIPGKGRGRIFYINQSGWGTTSELLSEPGYSTASIPSYGAKTIFNYYASLEKPRNASHDPSTLKIYIFPVLGTLESPFTNSVISDMLVIDPVAKTMSAVNMGFYNAAPNANTRMSLSKLATLPNGMTLVFNGVSYSRQGGIVHTGWDVPSAETGANDGTRQIIMTGKGILYQPDYYYQNGTGGGISSVQITSGAPPNLEALTDLNPGFTGLGGGVNALWPHTGKFITNASVSNDNPFIMIVEINSIKGYGPNITNFNFSDRDQTGYQVPPSLANLGPSIFNCQFNKMK